MSPAAAARNRRQAHFCRDRDAEGQPPGPQGPDRRAFLSLLGGGLAAGGALLREARAAEDQTLQALIEQNQRRELGQDFDSASRTIHMPRASLPTLSPSTVDTTAQAIGRYEATVAGGGWPKVPPIDRLRLGNRHWLNIPVEVRLSQLKTNLARLRTLTGHLPNRYVVCNIPASQIEAVEDGVAVSRHTAVVGKPDRPSPEINSKIIEANFSPFWTVPVSIVWCDLIPLMQKDPAYLTNEHIRIFDLRHDELTPSQINWHSDETLNYLFKQDPGSFNSLGSIRINFPSKDGVYMHDTPLKNLFGEDLRFHSSGCVRV
jgi:murein L,D-transpeptidase YcbB/YkuD